MTGAPLVSIVVPTLQEAQVLPGLLDHLATLPGAWEVIVADGGSRDGTAEIAAAHPSSPLLLVGLPETFDRKLAFGGE